MAERPFTLSIAGVDPSAGAGLLADIKTFEQLKVYGLGVPTANTIQTHDRFFANQWLDPSYIIEGVSRMVHTYDVKAVKIGIIENSSLLFDIVDIIKRENVDARIVWDPVIRSSSSFDFQTSWIISHALLKRIDVITPNAEEWEKIKTNEDFSETTILLKGGHVKVKRGTDKLIEGDEVTEIPPVLNKKLAPKHGSGCVLSSALTAFLAKGEDIPSSSRKAKAYVENFMASTNDLLGYHHGENTLHIPG